MKKERKERRKEERGRQGEEGWRVRRSEDGREAGKEEGREGEREVRRERGSGCTGRRKVDRGKSRSLGSKGPQFFTCNRASSPSCEQDNVGVVPRKPLSVTSSTVSPMDNTRVAFIKDTTMYESNSSVKEKKQ